MLPYSSSCIHDSDIHKSSVMVVFMSFGSKRSKHEDNRPKISSLRTEFVSCVGKFNSEVTGGYGTTFCTCFIGFLSVANC